MLLGALAPGFEVERLPQVSELIPRRVAPVGCFRSIGPLWLSRWRERRIRFIPQQQVVHCIAVAYSGERALILGQSKLVHGVSQRVTPLEFK